MWPCSAITRTRACADRNIVGLANDPDRIFLEEEKPPVDLEDGRPSSLLLKKIRDEAHRFAITGHRRAQSKSRQSSVLESVPGLGPSRRRNLLRHFGGLQGVVKAGVEDLMAVRGISRTLAEAVYDHLHPGSR